MARSTNPPISFAKIFWPSRPSKFAKLGKKAEESTVWLFGDSVSEFLDASERKQTEVSIEG